MERTGVAEAKLVATEHGLVPEGDGWFVLNARDAPWFERKELGRGVYWEGEHRWTGVGVTLYVLQPGQSGGMYHAENCQEDFLVLSGEAVLIVEGKERPLKQWDFVHCPPWTEHIIVNTGDAPCLIFAAGSRHDNEDEWRVRYPFNTVAAKYDACAHEDTTDPKQAYARFSPIAHFAYRDGDLPGDAAT